jgi:hypothetical protein
VLTFPFQAIAPRGPIGRTLESGECREIFPGKTSVAMLQSLIAQELLGAVASVMKYARTGQIWKVWAFSFSTIRL